MVNFSEAFEAVDERQSCFFFPASARSARNFVSSAEDAIGALSERLSAAHSRLPTRSGIEIDSTMMSGMSLKRTSTAGVPTRDEDVKISRLHRPGKQKAPHGGLLSHTQGCEQVS